MFVRSDCLFQRSFPFCPFCPFCAILAHRSFSLFPLSLFTHFLSPSPLPAFHRQPTPSSFLPSTTGHTGIGLGNSVATNPPNANLPSFIFRISSSSYLILVLAILVAPVSLSSTQFSLRDQYDIQRALCLLPSLLSGRRPGRLAIPLPPQTAAPLCISTNANFPFPSRQQRNCLSHNSNALAAFSPACSSVSLALDPRPTSFSTSTIPRASHHFFDIPPFPLFVYLDLKRDRDLPSLSPHARRIYLYLYKYADYKEYGVRCTESGIRRRRTTDHKPGTIDFDPTKRSLVLFCWRCRCVWTHRSGQKQQADKRKRIRLSNQRAAPALRPDKSTPTL